MQLVPASQFTIEELTENYNQTRVDYLVPMPMSARRLREYVDVYDIDLDASVVAMDGDEVLGLCMLGVREDRAWITRLGVLPTSRRRGTGRAMMEHVIEQAVQRNLGRVMLEVITGNDPAYRMFDSLGFQPFRNLLILRRPPGAPPPIPQPGPADLEWLDGENALACIEYRPWSVAWTNQPESLHNTGGLRVLRAVDHETEDAGWVCFKPSAVQLKRVIVSPEVGTRLAPAFTLLYHLHTTYPRLDTIAENVPADARHLDMFYALSYIESFSRVEMVLPLI